MFLVLQYFRLFLVFQIFAQSGTFSAKIVIGFLTLGRFFRIDFVQMASNKFYGVSALSTLHPNNGCQYQFQKMPNQNMTTYHQACKQFYGFAGSSSK